MFLCWYCLNLTVASISQEGSESNRMSFDYPDLHHWRLTDGTIPSDVKLWQWKCGTCGPSSRAQCKGKNHLTKCIQSVLDTFSHDIWPAKVVSQNGKEFLFYSNLRCLKRTLRRLWPTSCATWTCFLPELLTSLTVTTEAIMCSSFINMSCKHVQLKYCVTLSYTFHHKDSLLFRSWLRTETVWNPNTLTQTHICTHRSAL